MSVIEARYFDGKTSTPRPVTLVFARGMLKIVGADVHHEVDARRVRRSLRIAGTPRWLYLPGGGACVTNDNDAVDRVTRSKRYERVLNVWEARPHYAVLALALVVGLLWLLVDRGVPIAAEQVAARIPPQAEAVLGRQTLQVFDQRFMQPSRLSRARRDELRAEFAAMAAKLGEETPYTLEFRRSLLGANAFALPSGIIVVTDELVDLSKSDDEVLGVLAHELGHVRGRHTMRQLLEGSATALIIAGVTGDIASTTSLAAAAPTLLLQTRFSRDNEREADRFAVDAMRAAGMNPMDFSRLLVRIEHTSGRGPGLPSFLSTHPQTPEREALARAAAGAPARIPAGEHVDFTGFWKEKCDKLYGIQFRPTGKGNLYAVSLCGPAGCLDPGTYRRQTTVEGDPDFDVIGADELYIRHGPGGSVSYVKCSSAVMAEMPDK